MEEKREIVIKRETSIPKIVCGIVFAVLSIAAWLIWFPHSKILTVLSLCFFAGFPILGFFRIETHTKRASVAVQILWGLVCIVFAMASAFPFPTSFSFSIISVTILRIFWNLLCAFFIVAVFLVITASWRLSVLISAGFLLVLLLANNVSYCLRGNELSIGDFVALETALNVADQYRFQVSTTFLFLCMSFTFAMFTLFTVRHVPALRLPKLPTRMISAASAVIFALALSFATATTPLQTWDDSGTQKNGYLLNFLVGIRNMRIEAPNGYSPEAVADLGSYYGSLPTPDSPVQDKAVNIIVVMNESFADLNVFKNPLNTNIPVTPFLDSLTENTVKGHALCSVFSGKTANSEFEFLTGHSMAFFPSGSVPYQQYIKNNTLALPWVMNSYGYTTFATHPYLSNGWSRTSIYPKFGFHNYTFLEDYPQEDIIRTYVSDREMYDYVLNRLETKSSADPTFIMGITMQNHGGYLYEGDNYDRAIELEGYQQDYPQAEQYLSLLHESDRAIGDFLAKLQNIPENTLVLFFGDHQPKIETAFYEELNGGKLDTLEEQMRQYTVPFFIWANYDIEPAQIPVTSLNYLPCYLLQYAGLEMPTYYRALLDMQTTIPAINALGYYSAASNRFLPLESATGKEKEMLDRYRYLQYNNLFDTDHRNSDLFEKYLPQ